MTKKDNIILIGMHASGKSSIGVIIAKVLGKDFLDVDLVIQQREKALLCDIIASKGTEGFFDHPSPFLFPRLPREIPDHIRASTCLNAAM